MSQVIAEWEAENVKSLNWSSGGRDREEELNLGSVCEIGMPWGLGNGAEGLEGDKAGVTKDGITCNQHGQYRKSRGGAEKTVSALGQDSVECLSTRMDMTLRQLGMWI